MYHHICALYLCSYNPKHTCILNPPRYEDPDPQTLPPTAPVLDHFLNPGLKAIGQLHVIIGLTRWCVGGAGMAEGDI